MSVESIRLLPKVTDNFNIQESSVLHHLVKLVFGCPLKDADSSTAKASSSTLQQLYMAIVSSLVGTTDGIVVRPKERGVVMKHALELIASAKATRHFAAQFDGENTRRSLFQVIKRVLQDASVEDNSSEDDSRVSDPIHSCTCSCFDANESCASPDVTPYALGISLDQMVSQGEHLSGESSTESDSAQNDGDGPLTPPPSASVTSTR